MLASWGVYLIVHIKEMPYSGLKNPLTGPILFLLSKHHRRDCLFSPENPNSKESKAFAAVSLSEPLPCAIMHIEGGGGVEVKRVFIGAGCNRIVNNVSWGASGLVSFGAHNAVAIFCPKVPFHSPLLPYLLF